MHRGEIWWANLSKPIGRRPIVLLSRDESYSVRNAVIVAVVTSTIRNIPVEVNLGIKDGLPKKCVINLDTIITIRKELLIEKIADLTTEKINEVDESIKFALDLK